MYFYFLCYLSGVLAVFPAPGAVHSMTQTKTKSPHGGVNYWRINSCYCYWDLNGLWTSTARNAPDLQISFRGMKSFWEGPDLTTGYLPSLTLRCFYDLRIPGLKEKEEERGVLAQTQASEKDRWRMELNWWCSGSQDLSSRKTGALTVWLTGAGMEEYISISNLGWWTVSKIQISKTSRFSGGTGVHKPQSWSRYIILSYPPPH